MAEVSQTKVGFGTGTLRTGSNLENALCYLAFEGSVVRIGLELSCCVLAFFALKFGFPWSAFNITPPWVPLLSWLGSCILISALDFKIFARAVGCFKEAKRSDYDGSYAKALDALDAIAPTSGSTICLPAKRYHLFRSRVLTHAGFLDRALAELLLAAHQGADGIEYFRQRIELQRAKGDYGSALSEVKAAQQRLKNSSLLMLEEALLTLHERSDIRKAKQQLQAVIGSSREMFHGDQTTLSIGGAFYAVTMLWTGYAEEGLEALDMAIDRIKVDACYSDELLPYAAWLLLERAYYLVTHKEPERALADVTLAKTLCRYPLLDKLLLQLQDEFDWRYKIKLT